VERALNLAFLLGLSRCLEEAIHLLLLTIVMVVIALLLVVVFVLCREGYAWKLFV
jgi:hypothetical protein